MCARERHYVDNNERLQGSASSFDIITGLNKHYQNVESIEVTNYNIPDDMATSFYEATPNSPGNNLLDIRVQTPNNSDSLEFTVTIPTDRRWTTPSNYIPEGQIVEAYFKTLLDDTMDAQGDAYFNTGNNIEWVVSMVSFQEYYQIVFELKDTTNPGTPVAQHAFFLFGSGPNAGNSCERFMGFIEGEDTKVYTSSYQWAPPFSFLGNITGPAGIHLMQFIPYRYVDVFIQEMEPNLLTNVPSARVFVSEDITYSSSRELPSRPRLMTTPLRTTDKLRVYLELEDQRLPTELSTNGWDVSLDILSLSNETTIPDWVAQRLHYSLN